MRIPDYVLHLYLVTHFFPRYHGNIKRGGKCDDVAASDEKSGRLDAWINTNFDPADYLRWEMERLWNRLQFQENRY